mgnify:FL=1
MSLEDKDVDTLNNEELDQNTDTNVDTDSTDTGTDDLDSVDDSEVESDIDSDTNSEDNDSDESQNKLSDMSDEEFLALMDSKGTITATNSDKKTKTDTNVPKDTNKRKSDAVDDKLKDQNTDKEPTKVDNQEVDYKSIYEQVFKPFKANGKEITPKTVEDVISLMQMGANYTKKMQLMAPMKKVVQSLDNAKIDEQELNFLIDVSKGDKEAIKQLLIKHKIDPLEIDLDGDNTYSPKNNIASDEDVEFNDTLMDIHDSLPKIQEILNKTWDDNSKKAILKDPRLMRALHEEVQMGRFDEVQKRLETEKTFGRYRGISDVDAYIDLVSKMEQERMKTKIQPETPIRTESTKKIPDKSKAAPTKGKTSKSSSSLTAKDLLSMSDDEFNKLSERDLV